MFGSRVAVVELELSFNLSHSIPSVNRSELLGDVVPSQRSVR